MKINEDIYEYLLYVELPSLIDRIAKEAIPNKEYVFAKDILLEEMKKVIDRQIKASTTYIESLSA